MNDSPKVIFKNDKIETMKKSLNYKKTAMVSSVWSILKTKDNQEAVFNHFGCSPGL